MVIETRERMATMTRAWQFRETGGPERLALVEHELPSPGPGEALVRFEAIGLNRADLLELAGRYFGPPPSPSFIGQEAVGTIAELGPPVEGQVPCGGFTFDVGDRVGLMVGRIDHRGMGTYRTAGIYPQRRLLPLPEPLSFAEGAGLWLTALTAVTGLDVGHVTRETARDRKVLVTAASSGVGVMTLQAARGMGAVTVAATTSPHKAARLEELADHVVVARNPDALVDGVNSATDGAGVDCAFDPVGFDYAQALLQTAAQDGHVVVYGLLSGTEAPLDYRTMIFKDLGLHGFTVHRIQRDPPLLERAMSTILELVENGDLRPLIADSYAFEEAPRALKAMASNRHLGKIVLTVAEA
jgi:NADPH:quinone reductase-like Zn-dependent oxidoreductase